MAMEFHPDGSLKTHAHITHEDIEAHKEMMKVRHFAFKQREHVPVSPLTEEFPPNPSGPVAYIDQRTDTRHLEDAKRSADAMTSNGNSVAKGPKTAGDGTQEESVDASEPAECGEDFKKQLEDAIQKLQVTEQLLSEANATIARLKSEGKTLQEKHVAEVEDLEEMKG